MNNSIYKTIISNGEEIYNSKKTIFNARRINKYRRGINRISKDGHIDALSITAYYEGAEDSRYILGEPFKDSIKRISSSSRYIHRRDTKTWIKSTIQRSLNVFGYKGETLKFFD